MQNINDGIEYEVGSSLQSWCEQMLSYRIPRWKELPEIELYMDQVLVLMERYLGVFNDEINRTVSASIINNYVKLGIVPPPIKKRYSKTHIAYLLMICILKQVLPIPSVMRIIENQTKNCDIESVYDRFCEEQEQSLLAVLRQTLHISGVPTESAIFDDFILKTVTNANSSKTISEKLLTLRS